MGECVPESRARCPTGHEYRDAPVKYRGRRDSPCYSHPSFRGAPLGTSPESILTMVVMDSGPAPYGASRNDGGDGLNPARFHAWMTPCLRPSEADRAGRGG